MKRLLKIVGGIVLALLLLLLAAGATLHGLGQRRLAAAPQVAGKPVAPASSAEALARGEHIAVALSACGECHGESMGGDILINEAPIGYLPSPNLTAGRGGIGGKLTDAQWELAIRHGVGHDGRTLGGMPSQAYARMSDDDFAALLGYLKQLPPVDNDLGARNITFPGTIIFGVLAYGELPINVVDHANVGGSAPPLGATADYGEYVVELGVCRDCHGAQLAGRVSSDGSPPGPNLTPGGELAGWDEADFITALRSGTTPTGRQLSEEMPWSTYRHMSDDELRAVWVYLQGLPARALDDN